MRQACVRFAQRSHLPVINSSSESPLRDDPIIFSAPLVDAEGFPRADVDVHATRTARHRLACLNTDHKALMEEIEKGLHALHAGTPVQVSSALLTAPAAAEK